MRKEPLISIVLPTHNRALTIVRAVNSVLDQSYRNIELIVVDDASTDSSLELLGQIDDPRLHILKQSQCGGAASARNRGVAHAKGEYLAFQDSDDYWLPEKLAKQVKLIARQREPLGLVYCSALRIHGQGRQVNFIPFNMSKQIEGNIHSNLLARNFIWTQTWLLKRELFDALGGFDAKIKRLEDWDFVLRLSKQYPIGCVAEPMVMIYDTAGSLVNQDELYADDMRQLLANHPESFNGQPRVLATHLRAVGYRYCLYRSPAEGRVWFRRAIKAYPVAVRAWAGLALSYFGVATFKRAAMAFRQLKQQLGRP